MVLMHSSHKAELLQLVAEFGCVAKASSRFVYMVALEQRKLLLKHSGKMPSP
jgi:hypothetical protein